MLCVYSGTMSINEIFPYTAEYKGKFVNHTSVNRPHFKDSIYQIEEDMREKLQNNEAKMSVKRKSSVHYTRSQKKPSPAPVATATVATVQLASLSATGTASNSSSHAAVDTVVAAAVELATPSTTDIASTSSRCRPYSNRYGDTKTPHLRNYDSLLNAEATMPNQEMAKDLREGYY